MRAPSWENSPLPRLSVHRRLRLQIYYIDSYWQINSLTKRRDQFDDRLFGQLCLSTEIVRFRNFVHVARAMARDRRYLRNRASGQS